VYRQEERVFRRIWGPKMDDVTEEWRKLHKQHLNNLYSAPNIVRVIKSRRMRWAGHVERMGRGEAYRGLWWENLKNRDHLKDSGVDGRIVLRLVSSKWEVGAWTGSIWLKIGTGGGHL
jgi:hypothetical protein